jgi:hypothetical protein
MSKVDLGNLCVHCRNDTSFGSGRFVNRYPVFDLDVDGNGIEETGYCCDECEQDCLEDGYIVCSNCGMDYGDGCGECPQCECKESVPYDRKLHHF